MQFNEKKKELLKYMYQNQIIFIKKSVNAFTPRPGANTYLKGTFSM